MMPFEISQGLRPFASSSRFVERLNDERRRNIADSFLRRTPKAAS